MAGLEELRKLREFTPTFSGFLVFYGKRKRLLSQISSSTFILFCFAKNSQLFYNLLRDYRLTTHPEIKPDEWFLHALLMNCEKLQSDLKMLGDYSSILKQEDYAEIIEIVSCIFLAVLNLHRINSAQILFEFLQKFRISVSCENVPWFSLNKDHFVFPDTALYSRRFRKFAILSAFRDIALLFSDPVQCAKLLQSLNNKIAAQYPCFSTLTPGKGILLYGNIQVPSPPPETWKPIKTHSLLHGLLREALQKHDIECQPESIIFSGFVDPEVANACIRDGQLFKEQYLMMNALLHGLLSHKIQWYLIACALEKVEINFYDGLTLRELMTEMVDVKIVKGELTGTAWNVLIDFLGRNSSHLGSPYRLNAWLLFHDDLPALRGCLLNAWYRDIQKYQCIIQKKYGTTLPYELLLAGQAIAFSAVELLNMGISPEDIKNIYQGRVTAEHGGKILRKNFSSPAVNAAAFFLPEKECFFPAAENTALLNNSTSLSPPLKKEVARECNERAGGFFNIKSPDSLSLVRPL